MANTVNNWAFRCPRSLRLKFACDVWNSSSHSLWRRGGETSGEKWGELYSCTWIRLTDGNKIRPGHINGITGREIINMTKTQAFTVTRSFTVTVEEMHNPSSTTREDIQPSQHFYTLQHQRGRREERMGMGEIRWDIGPQSIIVKISFIMTLFVWVTEISDFVY